MASARSCSFLLLLAACASSPDAEQAARKPVPNEVVFAATPVPDRIVLTWQSDPTSTQSVTWRTDGTGAAGIGQVAVATDGPLFRRKARDFAAVEVECDGARYHTVTFTGLQAKTKYAYRVGDGVDWSEWSHFTTASVEHDPFSFLYFGDAQNDLKSHWSRVIREGFMDAPRAAFVVHAGDLVNRGFQDGEWGEWFYSAGWILRSMPSLATPGNHEYRKGELSKFWRPQFAFPEDGPKGFEETVYSFEYQGVLFVSLDTNRELEPQVEWLDGIVMESEADWKIVTMHHPVFGTAKKRDSPKRRAILQPAFDRNGIDLVLQGHDHTYSRTGRMRHAHDGEGEHEHEEQNVPIGLRARDDQTGTVYVVSVSGPKMYKLVRQPFMVKATQKKQLYQVISIDGEKLTYSAHTATGRLFDRFELHRSFGAPNKLVETMPK